MTIPAGWYPDPEREGAQRWWDGELWAPSLDDGGEFGAHGYEATSPGASPDQASSETVPVPEPSWGWDRHETDTQQAGTPSWTDRPWQTDHQQWGPSDWDAAQRPPGSRKGPSLGLILGLAGGGLAVIIAGIVVGSILLSGIGAQQQQDDAGGVVAPITSFPASVDVDVAEDGEQVLELEIAEAGIYSIAVDSTNDEDPVLTLTLPDGEELQDDDGGEATYSSLLTEALEPGTYELGIAEYSGDALRATVVVTQDSVLEDLEPITSFPASTDVMLPTDAVIEQDIEVTELGLYTIGLTTTNGEDGYLSLLDPDGNDIVDDDSGGGLDPELALQLEPGTYTLSMSEYGGDAFTGTLSVDMTPVEEIDPIESVPATVDIEIGPEITQPIELTIDESGSYVISVVSTNDEDPTIELVSEAGEAWNDDDGGDGLDALLEVELEPGTYRLTISEYSGDPLDVTVDVSEA